MTIVADAPTISEAARERETFKYDALEISTAALRDPEAAKPTPSAALSSTPDPCLTAFAQLGLYRLRGSRALISLFDRKNQHIVAEALRAAPLGFDDEPVDLLWICGTAVPRATSVCEHVVTGAAMSMTVPGNATGNAPSDLPVSVILDLDQDERFNHSKDPHRRFYIGVPIRSPAGINIGVYCVFDDSPRQRVSPAEIQLIRDMSRTVMDYLDAKRSHEYYRREGRMVRGLGSFVEGKATLSNWSLSPNPAAFLDLPGEQEGGLNKRLQGPDRRGGKSAVAGARAKQTTRARAHETDAPVPDRPRSPTPKPTATSGNKPRVPSAGDLQEGVEGVFSKASNIIRESLEVAGAVYLDASTRTFGGMIGQEMSSPPVLGKPSSDESSSDEIPAFPGEAAEGACCKVLGYSTSRASSINGDAAVSSLTTLPEKVLHYLLQRYPHGKIFNMEPDAVPLSGDAALGSSLSVRQKPSETTTGNAPGVPHGQSQKPKLRQTLTSTFAKMFPGARSVAFVPLWDSQRHRWFAGSFVWTRTLTRIFTTENELSYLKVYALTIMAEVTRLHIKAADKTKMDVLGSISHELRSPLHGVVGAAELLLQTDLDSAQEKILRTIQISSRTLLDTIDHLLDYGKMNGLINSAKLTRSNSTSHLQNQQDPAEPGVPVQLDRLAEEVLESVLAGYGHVRMVASAGGMLDSGVLNQWSNRRPAKSDGSLSAQQHSPGQQPDGDSEPVQLFLDIEPAESWSFVVHPGAFRRIVMNVFGNSLKFTTTGFIRVHLRQAPPLDAPDKQVAGFGRILLTVSDSGKGISEEYLRNRLYTPFAQEDHFAPGTGLGLSLVRQVVTALGGEIHVTSQVGCGTAVAVSLPLPTGGAWTDDEETNFKAVAEDLAGLRVVLRSNGQGTAREGPHGGTGSFGQDGAAKSQLQLIGDICQGWLKMHIVSEAESHGSPPDFIISTNGAFSDLDAGGAATCPHVFVCHSSRVAQSIANQRRMPGFFEVVSQPLGPRKLAKSLYDSLRRWRAAQGLLPRPNSTANPPEEEPLLTNTASQAVEMTPILKVAGTLGESTSLAPPAVPPAPPSDEPSTKAELESVADGVVPENINSVSAAPPCAADIGPVDARRSVLIVDDNPINRKILAAYMNQIEQPHSMATNGLEALEKYKESPSEYSCILTDISMPVMDGLESSRRAREFERAGQLPPCKIIAVTGLSGADVEQDAFASGIDVFLTRPVTLKTVVDTLVGLGLR